MTHSPVIQDILVPCNPGCLNTVQIENETCSIKYDRILRSSVLIMKGNPSSACVRIPPEGRTLSCTSLPYILLVLQTWIGSFDTFALEVTMNVHASFRVKLIIGTQFNKASSDCLINGLVVTRMPLVVPRNRWVQVVFHLSGMVTQLFDLPAIKSIQSISLIGNSRIFRLMMSNNENEAINATPVQMPLFAVPAYAPPIWLTALPPAPLGGASSGGSFVGSGVNTTDSACKHLPFMTKKASEPHGALSCARHDEILKSRLLQSPFLNQQHSSGVDSGKPCNSSSLQDAWRAVGSSALLNHGLEIVSAPKQEGEEPPVTSSEAVSYIRLVNQTNASVRGNTNNLARVRSVNLVTKGDVGNAVTPMSSSASPSVPASTALADTLSGITGWEETADIRSAVGSFSSHRFDCVRKVWPLSNQGSSGERGSAAGNNSKANNAAEQISPKSRSFKKMIELRKRPLFPNRSRRVGGSEGTTPLDNDNGMAAPNTVKKRIVVVGRASIRRRIRLLREAQVSARRALAMRGISASELQIDLQDGSLMMVGDETIEVKKEPRCGYGFGYLGVLHESGGFETEEGVNMKLKGALTLKLPEPSEDEEDNDEDDE